MTDIVRYEKKVPDNYVNQSRDFQVLLRLFTFALNAGKVEAESLIHLNNPEFVNNRFVNLLQAKVGFFTKKEFKDDDIREVLKVFKSIINLKGTKTAIEQAIRVYFQVFNLNTSYTIDVINKHGSAPYEIRIGVNTSIKDYTLLEEMLKYILPIGYILTIYFYKDITYISEYANTSTIDISVKTDESRYRISSSKNLSLGRLDTTTIAKAGYDTPVITSAENNNEI